MRKLITNPVARALPALLAVTALVACAGDDTVSTTGAPSTTETTETTSTPAASATTGTGSSTEVPAATETTTSTVTPPPPVGSCDEAAVREAIANADAVAAGVSFEFTYLKCAEGFGWAEILADFGDQATVLFAGSGTDVELLNLGTSVCVPDSGIPADVAAQLAPDPRHPFGDCPMSAPDPGIGAVSG
jgi:hypothetical protein